MSQPTPADADPRLFWNGQYLLEDDPENPADYSKAAQEAQRAKWLQLMENRGPSKTLPLEMIPEDGSKPPLYHYGIPFIHRYMLECAKRHHLTMELRPETGVFFDGKSEFDFADISLEDEEEEEFMNSLLGAGRSAAVRHIETRCGITLHVARPFSLEWDGMLSMWSNYDIDIDERHSNLVRTRKRFLDIVETMHEGGQESDIEWCRSFRAPYRLE